jgi:5'-3' exonuclease
MQKNLNTLLVDANYLFKRSLFGAKHVYARSKPIGGLYSFMTTVRKLISEHNINKVVLCWDGENSGKLRYYIYEGYKANRESKSWYNKISLTEKQINREEKDMGELYQRIRIKQYAEELFIRQIEVDEIEADDIIAYYCKYKKPEENVLIFTNDRDYFQLMDYVNVSIYVDNKAIVIDKDIFFMHFDYHYSNALTLKILCGDTSDNINGIEGLQEKTILKHFPQLKERHVPVKEIYSEAFKISRQRKIDKKTPLKVIDKIIEGKDILVRNKKLMDLKKPMMSKQAIDEIPTLYDPLDSNDRGSKNLISMMNEDGFLDNFNSSFVNYVTPFYSVIMKEKEYYNNHMNSSKYRRNSLLK